MATFTADIRQWHTIGDFSDWIGKFPDSDFRWIEKIVLHHTIKPVVSQWRGKRSMEDLLTFYRDTRHWAVGPHLFICTGSIVTTDDGIWQLTPMNTPGIHAGDCNHNGLGIEVVGNYDVTPWSPPTKAMIYGTVLALLRRCSLGPCDVYGHRECLANKTCPGKAIDMRRVRYELADQFTIW